MLHEENASILTLLPALATGLVTKTSHLDVILKFIDAEVNKSQQNTQKVDRLIHVKNQLEDAQIDVSEFSLDIDKPKTLLLAYTFGEIYTPALALFTGRHITIELWGSDLEGPSVDTIEKSIMGDSGCESMFIHVSDAPKVEQRQEEQNVNPFLQVRAMLAKVGILMSLSTFDLEKPDETEEDITEDIHTKSADPKEETGNTSSKSDHSKPRTSTTKSIEYSEKKTGITNTSSIFNAPTKNMVDPYNWFCSCSQFTKKSFTAHNRSGTNILGMTTCSPVMAGIFGNSKCKYPKTLPICQHLLAVLLMLFNWNVAVDAGLVHAYWVQSEATQIEIPLKRQANKVVH
ncbi:hypothetical protein JCM33374_g490 [Metschnikowia sp. JCM 33374]|nr:hypothetical protein JCM33374_g490 [Metschnikowia sp. JCM 33374]